MDNEFIYIILTIIAVSILWAAYELYQTRKWVEGIAKHVHDMAEPKRYNISIPAVFDQEQQ